MPASAPVHAAPRASLLSSERIRLSNQSGGPAPAALRAAPHRTPRLVTQPRPPGWHPRLRETLTPEVPWCRRLMASPPGSAAAAACLSWQLSPAPPTPARPGYPRVHRAGRHQLPAHFGEHHQVRPAFQPVHVPAHRADSLGWAAGWARPELGAAATWQRVACATWAECSSWAGKAMGMDGTLAIDRA